MHTYINRYFLYTCHAACFHLLATCQVDWLRSIPWMPCRVCHHGPWAVLAKEVSECAANSGTDLDEDMQHYVERLSSIWAPRVRCGSGGWLWRNFGATLFWFPPFFFCGGFRKTWLRCLKCLKCVKECLKCLKCLKYLKCRRCLTWNVCFVWFVWNVRNVCLQWLKCLDWNLGKFERIEIPESFEIWSMMLLYAHFEW